MKKQRYFNTSGPNRPHEHYTLMREALVEKGLDYVKRERYFTIWAPRQTGKSTYFSLLTDQLRKRKYKVCHINLENYAHESLESFFAYLFRRIQKDWKISLTSTSFGELHNDIASIENEKCVLIVDEIEGLNSELLDQFLHTIRNLYHFRHEHCLKSVVLVGVSNIVGVIQDNASPFNIADNLDIPFFSREEVMELLGMHENEAGQFFETDVKVKITGITGNQPGLVNGFAYQLVEKAGKNDKITISDFFDVERWYLTQAIDKNIENVIAKSSVYRHFVERLLFEEEIVKFDIGRPAINFLFTQGVIRPDSQGVVEFTAPVYKKKLFSSFYPYSNGETKIIREDLILNRYYLEDESLNFEKLIAGYRKYIKKRGFRAFREKDADGGWKHTREAAMVYSFETYIQMLLQEIGGTSYLESATGLGQSDLIINVNGRETVIEFKIYRSPSQLEKGRVQVAYYAKSLSIEKAVYIVFVKNVYKKTGIKDETVHVEGVSVMCFPVFYDEDKDF